MHAIELIGHGLWEAFAMFWATLWALVLGFGLSGAVQAFVSRERMQRALGDRKPKTLAKASIFGIISSSCSYAASALAKTLFARGADFTTSLVFMIASTNLVVELGLVLWLLMGWEFALAELVGGAIMIALLGILARWAFPPRVAAEARAHLAGSAAGSANPHEHMHDGAHDGHGDVPAPADGTFWSRIRSRQGWSEAAAYTISDLTMIRKELAIGFLVAGLIAVLVPVAFWQSVLLTDGGFLGSLENVVVGPVLAIVSFVCSVGNVPLAAALWHGGISFGGVVAFVFADLITLPLLVIYRGYFGMRITWRILGAFWLSMSAAGLAVEYLFRWIGIPEPERAEAVMSSTIGWNHTTYLNIAALAAFGLLYWLYRTRRNTGRYAKDPVCGMQVEIANAPAHRELNGEDHWFCSDRCARRFDAEHGTGDPSPDDKENDMDEHTHDGHEHDAHAGHEPHAHGHDTHEGGMRSAENGSHRDPVCGMRVDPATAAGSVEHEGETYWFCSPGCLKAFSLNPDVFATA